MKFIEFKIFGVTYRISMRFSRSKQLTYKLPECGVYDCGIVDVGPSPYLRYWRTDKRGLGPEKVDLPMKGKEFRLKQSTKKSDRDVTVIMFF